MGIGENREIGSLVERILQAAQDGRAIGICNIEYHHADGVVALTAQRLGKDIWAIAQSLGGLLNAPFSRQGDITRQRRIVENDGDRARGESAGARDIAYRRCSFGFPAPQWASCFTGSCQPLLSIS